MRTCLLLIAASVTLSAQPQQPNYQPNWPCTGKERTFDPAFLRAAEATGGQLFLLDRSETSALTVIAIEPSKHPATVARSVGKLENYLDVHVPIDPSIESLYISATVQCLQRVILWDPQIVEVLPKQVGGQDHVFRAVRISVIPKPTPGIWTIRLLGTGAYSLVVQAKTRRSFSGDFDGHTITASTDSAAPRFRLVTEAGDPLQPLALETSGQGRYSATIPPPAERFRLLTEGVDPQGYPFQRLDSRLFEPKPLKTNTAAPHTPD
jgi:hypothetical protein